MGMRDSHEHENGNINIYMVVGMADGRTRFNCMCSMCVCLNGDKI